jgi:hypothetical protein
MPWVNPETAHPIEISEVALGLYSQMRVLRCDCKPPPPDRSYWDPGPECDGCVAWGVLNKQLARLIRLPCYEVHCTLPPHGEPFLEAEQERTDMFEAALAERGDKTPA